MNSKLIAEFEKLIKQKEHEFLTAPKAQQIHKSFSLLQTKNALKIIRAFPTEIKNDAELSQLQNIDGIGKKTIDRIKEILDTGKLSEIKKEKQIEKHLDQIQELEQIIGIGPAKAHKFVTQYKIKSISELIKAYKSQKIDLDHQIVMGLKYHNKYQQVIPRSEVLEIDNYIHTICESIDIDLFSIICGSYRRGKMSSNDIDILITHPSVKTKKQLENMNNYLLDDLTDKNYENKYMGFCKYNNNPIRRIDIRYIPYKSYYTALLYFTGSGDFNKKMREHAITLGYKLSEYGLFKKKNDKFIKIKIQSEKDIFKKLGLEYVTPEERDI
jgi:DNA polymerase/3'-5' exonuclease PolX